MLQSAKFFSGDRGYDDTKLVTLCWDTYHIKPVIDIRNMWKDSDATRTLPGQTTVTYNYRGTVFCHDPVTGATHSMSNGGFEEARHTLKKRCPARFAGISCAGQDQCPVAPGLRIPLETDRRVFTPLDRDSYKWDREYDHRTAVERVNSRLDVSFGFEVHTIRGLKKMRMRSGLALIVMLAMALGRIRQQHPKHLRSVVWSASGLRPRTGPSHQFSQFDKKLATGTGIWAWVVSDRRDLRVPGKPCWHVRHDSYLAYNAINSYPQPEFSAQRKRHTQVCH